MKSEDRMSVGAPIEPDLKFIREIKKSGGENLKNCFQCATCSVVCNLSPAEKPFPRKEMILASWGQSKKLMTDPDLWLCYQCNDCTARCPRGAKPGDVLAAIRSYAYKFYSFPHFMGVAVAKSWILPFLVLLPMTIILSMMMSFREGNFGFFLDTIKFSRFIPQSWLEVLFIGGNILIFSFAFIGLRRFWNGLRASIGDGQKMGFIPSLIITLKEIALHKNFKECNANKTRYTAHMLVFFGFLGAMMTAGLAVLGLVLFKLESPIPLGHPIKWLGNLSGAAGFIGLTIMTARRIGQKDKVGANSYFDWLFLMILYVVFTTGLLSQFIRLANYSHLAYSIYYIHLVTVFFLLWYAPYSKFAHMFYRTLALIHARSIGRTTSAKT
jgi:quinone-modifying oxidoreductase subunit QmoC